MGRDMFGQYLLIEGVVTKQELEKANSIIEQSHQTIGLLAIEAGYMRPTEAQALNQEQQKRDMPFGRLAVEQGILSDNQLQELLLRQTQQHVALGETLIQSGCLSQFEFEQSLAAFAAHGSQYKEVLSQLEKELGSERIIEKVIEVFPRLTMRTTKILIKLGTPESFGTHRPSPYMAQIGLNKSNDFGVGNNSAIYIGLGADKAFCRRIMDGMSRVMAGGDSNFDYGDTSEDFEDLLGGFLDMVVGHALKQLSADEKTNYNIEPPTYGQPSGHGCVLSLESTSGDASIFVLKSIH